MATIDLRSVTLGPLTTTWTPPPACTVAVASCAICNYGWLAQTCGASNDVHDAVTCWPPRSAGAFTRPLPLMAWGVYTPGIVCPHGYTTACSYDGSKKTGDFDFVFAVETSETAVGCCPTGYVCSGDPGNPGRQTCLAELTSTVLPTVTCESGTSAHFEYLSIPYAVADDQTAVILSTYTVLAPLIQLKYQASDLPKTTTKSTRTSTSTSSGSSRSSSSSSSSSTGSSTSALPLETSSASSSQQQGLSTGAAVGIACGVGIGVILLAAIAFFIFRSKRRKNLAESTGAQQINQYDPKFPAAYQTQPPVMMAGKPPERPIAELGVEYIGELEGDYGMYRRT